MTTRRILRPDETRRRLLHAATIEFAANGLQGARIEKIAQQAGTNVQAIYYHFGKKKDLFSATIESIFEGDKFDQISKKVSESSPREAIQHIIDFMFDVYTRHPLAHTLLIDDKKKKPSGYLKSLSSISQSFEKLLASVKGALDRGAAEGCFRTDLDAVRVFLSITSLTGNYLYKVSTHSALFERDFGSARERKEWAEFIHQLLLSGLAPTPCSEADHTKLS